MSQHFNLILKRLLPLLLFAFVYNFSYASHSQGGEITMRCLGGNQYELRLALYRDCSGVNAPNTVTVNYRSASCNINLNAVLNRIPNTGIDVSPLCPSATSVCRGGNLPGVEEYIYTAIVTLLPCNDWVMSYSLCCRNNAITTLNTSGAMYIESQLDNLNYPCNNSPTFTNKPVPFICVGQQYCFNNGANDIDGDSLSYQMVIPATSATNNVVYTPPYSATQPLASNPAVTLNPLTGDICMTPTQLQVTVFAVLVTEWRNGVPIGQIRRDIQIRTITCNNNNPYLNGINNTGNYNINHCIGSPLTFSIPSFDNDPGDNVTLTWNNGIPGGTFNPGTGSNPTATFTWNPTINDVSTTPYCFTVTAADDNCPIIGTQSYSFCITVGGFTTSTTSTDVICTNTNGTASVTPANSPGPFTYLWSPGGQTTPSVTGLAAGTYTVTTSDALGCSVIDTIVINSIGNATASITSYTDALCNGDNNGSITAALTGPNLVPPLTYVWNPAVAGNVPTANNLGTGTYTVIITDSQGCTDTISQVISEPAPLSINTNFVNVGCFGASTGSASANASGGTPGYSYLWMPGAYNTPNISSLPTGTYTVTVTDTNGCTNNSSVTIVEPAPLSISSSVIDANCGLSDGSATVVGSGGFPPYTWTWSNSQTGPTATNLAAGTYTVTLTDGNFCTKTISVSVGNNAGPTVQVSAINNVTCNGDDDGNITVVVTGGTSPYTYLWNNGQITPTASNLAPGLYNVIITDANGCSATIDTIITEPTPLTNNFISVDPLCFGGNTGSASANPLGGTPPYSYLWSMSGNPTTQTVNNLAAGTYSVTITDTNGCNITQTVTITNPPTVNTVITPFDVSCFSACDGMAATTITNGVPPYTYAWNDPLNQTTDTAKFLCAGNYQVNIVDGNGCTSQATVTINEPTPLTASVTSKGDLQCYQDCIGFAQVTATGGTAPYTYNWSNSATSSTATNLCAGSYSCTVTDANGCTSIATVIITEPTQLVATVTGTDIKCFNSCDGTGNISFSGGTAPYSFLWTPGLQTINNPNDLCPGQNIAEITDANGCKVTDTINLTQSTPILVNAIVTNVSNCGQPNGSACVTPSGGLPPYSYVWNTNPTVTTTSCINNMVAGTYSVDVTDSNGCLKTEVININDVQAPNVTIVSHTDLLCFGDTNGSAITNITGGAPPYTILWTAGNQTVQNPTNLNGGTHTITVTDSANCVSSASVTILEPADINSTILSSSNVTCFGLCNGNAVASAVGGTGTLNYLWNDPGTQTTASANNLCAGNYTVTITDDNNCTKTNSVTITEPAELKIDSNSFENLSCFQDNTGSIYTHVTGGTPFYTYNWTPNISTSPVANALPAGNYSLQVVDQNGCTVNENWTITEPALLTGTPSQLDATCSFSNGSATIAMSGGTTPYSYSWNDPNLQTTPTASNLFAGTYTVVVTDTNNCSFTQNYTIIDQSGPVIDTITTTPVSCFGGNNGTASVALQPNTGTTPFTYAWNPSPQTLPNISGLSAGTYNVIVTDSNGCVASGNITVTEPPLLQLFSSIDDTICFGDTIMIYGQASGGTTPYSYTWTGAPGLNQVGTNDVFPVGTTTYTVSVTDSNGCNAGPNNVTINVLPALNVIATDTFMCEGDSVLISALASGGNGNPYIYSWDNGDTTQSQYVNPALVNSPMNYIITLDDGCSTPAYDTATVIVNPTPIVDSIVTTDVLCHGGSTGTANVFVNAASPTPITYDWGFISQLNPLLTGLSVGQYYVTITDNNGCSVDDSVTINQPDSLVLTVIGDSICFGATGQISASTIGGIAPYTYTWTGLPSNPTTGGPHNVTPATSTVYTVSVTDSNNCVVPPINVDVKVGPPLSVVATDDEVCEGKTANISATPSGGGTPYSYSWSNGGNTQNQSVLINQTDTFFIVTLTDGCSTPATDTSFVTVNLNPTGSLAAYPKEGCIPLEVNFVANSNDGIQYYWDYGDNNTTSTTLDTTTYTYINSGNYDIRLTIVNLKGCSTVVDSINYIHAYPNPVADFIMDPNPVSIFDPQVQFTDLSYTNITSWVWDFAGYGTSNTQHPSFLFPDIPQDYPVSLTVIDNNGCTDSITKSLKIKPEWAFYVPNSFTPDMDNLNDGFSPNGFGIAKRDYSFYIYNRWGQLIFETHNLFEPWNGTYKNNFVQQDVYVWKAKFRAIDGTQHERMGRVTILK